VRAAGRFIVEAPLETRFPYHSGATGWARAIADRFAAHPRLRAVFCSNRKTANEWTRNGCTPLWHRLEDGPARLARARRAKAAVRE
jgi:hypothetical protein